MGLLLSAAMQMFRNHSVSATWLILCAIVLGGGLIEVHSHDGPTSEQLSSVVLGSEHNPPHTTEHIQPSISIDEELCPACTAAGQREGVLDASDPTPRLLAMVTRGFRAANDLTILSCDAQPFAPRGPPIA